MWKEKVVNELVRGFVQLHEDGQLHKLEQAKKLLLTPEGLPASLYLLHFL